MRLLLALLVVGAVGCSPYFRAKHEGVSLETGYDSGKKGASSTAACDDALKVLVARLRYFCGAPPHPPVCLEIAGLEAWTQGVRCYFRE